MPPSDSLLEDNIRRTSADARNTSHSSPSPRYQLRQRRPKTQELSPSVSLNKVLKKRKPRIKKMSNEALKRFFSSPYFAVAGASQDANKFGYKILAWYHTRSIPATPLNPRSASITLSTLPSSPTVSTIASPSTLPNPEQTSLSLVTAPPITLAVLKEAKKVGIKAVFLQPGTFDEKVLEYLHGTAPGESELDKGGFETHLAGFEVEDGQQGTGGGEGWCVLVDGDRGLKSAGRETKI